MGEHANLPKFIKALLRENSSWLQKDRPVSAHARRVEDRERFEKRKEWETKLVEAVNRGITDEELIEFVDKMVVINRRVKKAKKYAPSYPARGRGRGRGNGRTAVPSPARTRSRKKVSRPIFDAQSETERRHLLEKAKREHAKFLERKAKEQRQQAAERKKALAEQAEERKKALEAQRAIMAEKNRLAEENEQIRKEREAEKRLRSDKAIEHLIESRKRRR